jgi:[CysO sulfur-carrier protein]-S-L-cysteine hydrolase
VNSTCLLDFRRRTARTNVIQFDDSFFDEIVAHCQGEYPNEACGLLAGKEGIPVRVIPMRNADASPATYRLDPEEQYRVFEELDTDGLDVFGIFHSHTHSEAYPSPTDRRQAFYPEAHYLILSLQDRSKPALRGFRILDGEVTEEDVMIG